MLLVDDVIVADSIQLPGRHTGHDLRTDHVEDVCREPARNPHRGLLFRGLERNATAAVGAKYLPPFIGGVGAPTDAMQQVGPVNLDLLTGHFTITKTDVAIPIPGTDAKLEFTRTFNSNYSGQEEKALSGVLGYNWQPSAPVEQEYEGEAWTELREEHQDAIPPVYDQECEEEEFSHEECLVEEGLPAADWVELMTP